MTLRPTTRSFPSWEAAYQGIFLSQKDRLEGIKYFDFVMSDIHGLWIKELMDAKAEERIVLGSCCTAGCAA